VNGKRSDGKRDYYDISTHKPAYQSNTGHFYYAEKAVDGVLDRDRGRSHSCSLTQNNQNAFWELDLQGEYYIDRIAFYGAIAYNYFDKNLIFRVKQGNKWVDCGYFERVLKERENFVILCKKKGSKVQVYQTVHAYLQICELRVWGIEA